MGFETNENNRIYANVSCGRFVNKRSNINATTYTGKIMAISEKEDEYEGNKIQKIQLTMSDGVETAIITFTKNSWYGCGFFSRITVADISQPVTLGVLGSDQNEKMSFCWIRQNDKIIAKNNDFVQPEKVVVGKSMVLNWEFYDEEVAKIINDINSAIIADNHLIDGGDAVDDLTDETIPF